MNNDIFLFDKDVLIINRNLDFKNVKEIINFYIKITENLNSIIIDFKNINNPNSCVLVFMVSCIRNSRKKNQKIKFINVSKTLLELSKLYNIDSIIPI